MTKPPTFNGMNYRPLTQDHPGMCLRSNNPVRLGYKKLRKPILETQVRLHEINGWSMASHNHDMVVLHAWICGIFTPSNPFGQSRLSYCEAYAGLDIFSFWKVSQGTLSN